MRRVLCGRHHCSHHRQRLVGLSVVKEGARCPWGRLSAPLTDLPVSHSVNDALITRVGAISVTDFISARSATHARERPFAAPGFVHSSCVQRPARDLLMDLGSFPHWSVNGQTTRTRVTQATDPAWCHPAASRVPHTSTLSTSLIRRNVGRRVRHVPWRWPCWLTTDRCSTDNPSVVSLTKVRVHTCATHLL